MKTFYPSRSRFTCQLIVLILSYLNTSTSLLYVAHTEHTDRFSYQIFGDFLCKRISPRGTFFQFLCIFHSDHFSFQTPKHGRSQHP